MNNRAKRGVQPRDHEDNSRPEAEPKTFQEKNRSNLATRMLAPAKEARRGETDPSVAKVFEDAHTALVTTSDDLLKIKVSIDSPEKKGAREHGPRDAEIDLGRAFFSDGPEMAEARLVRLVAEMAAKHPEREEALKAKLAEAIGPTKEKKPKNTDATLRTDKEVETPPRTGHQLIEKFAALWDCREQISRQDFVRRFQTLLDAFQQKKSLGVFKLNSDAVKWVNFISKKSKIAMFYEHESVKIRCGNSIPEGYFSLRKTIGNGDPIPRSGSKEFRRLTALSLTNSQPT